MKIDKIIINNFRRYHGIVDIDLSTAGEKNIVLIGGKNGYGKTSLLLSIAWCLYGKEMSQVDDNFRKEIHKAKNYPSFIQQSLNWSSRENKFSVELQISQVDLPENINVLDVLGKIKEGNIIIKREFNISTKKETLTIKNPYSNKEVQDDDTKAYFINDYIIPLAAGKFIFFDAEKISEVANLSMKKEGLFINDALNKILGLDIYKTLRDDLRDYTKKLRTENVKGNIKEQMSNRKWKKSQLEIKITQKEEEEKGLGEMNKNLEKNIRIYDKIISQNSTESNNQSNQKEIKKQIEELKTKKKELKPEFNKLSEIIPLAILAGKLEEVNNHLELEDKIEYQKKSIEKIDLFIEHLFNKPPEPKNSTISSDDKIFFKKKAKNLRYLLKDDEVLDNIEFKHAFNNSQKDLIRASINMVKTHSFHLNL